MAVRSRVEGEEALQQPEAESFADVLSSGYIRIDDANFVVRSNMHTWKQIGGFVMYASVGQRLVTWAIGEKIDSHDVHGAAVSSSSLCLSSLHHIRSLSQREERWWRSLMVANPFWVYSTDR